VDPELPAELPPAPFVPPAPARGVADVPPVLLPAEFPAATPPAPFVGESMLPLQPSPSAATVEVSKTSDVGRRRLT
jgi:hypothetical protein